MKKLMLLFASLILLGSCARKDETILFEKNIAGDHDDWIREYDTVKRQIHLGSDAFRLPVEIAFTKAIDPFGCSRFAYIRLRRQPMQEVRGSSFQTESSPCGTRPGEPGAMKFETLVISGKLKADVNAKEHTIDGKLLQVNTLGEVVEY